MNCEECKERVLELIEREAVDPDGVRAVLARCPECRALFEQLQLALAEAARLPLEEPPEALDAAILRAASVRARQAKRPRRRRWMLAPSWAAAAAVLLAVGIAVWMEPGRDDQHAARQPAGSEREAQLRAEEPRGADERGSGQRVAATATSEVAEAPPIVRGQDMQAKRSTKRPSEAARLASAEDDRTTAQVETRAPRTLSTRCAERVQKVERRQQRGAEVDPEDLLAIGRCYLEAGDPSAARPWLERAAAHPKTEERARRALDAL